MNGRIQLPVKAILFKKHIAHNPEKVSIVIPRQKRECHGEQQRKREVKTERRSVANKLCEGADPPREEKGGKKKRVKRHNQRTKGVS